MLQRFHYGKYNAQNVLYNVNFTAKFPDHVSLYACKTKLLFLLRLI